MVKTLPIRMLPEIKNKNTQPGFRFQTFFESRTYSSERAIVKEIDKVEQEIAHTTAVKLKTYTDTRVLGNEDSVCDQYFDRQICKKMRWCELRSQKTLNPERNWNLFHLEVWSELFRTAIRLTCVSSVRCCLELFFLSSASV